VWFLMSCVDVVYVSLLDFFLDFFSFFFVMLFTSIK